MCPTTVRILFLTLQLIIRQHRSCQLKTAVRLNRKLISDGTCAFRWKHVKNVRWGRLRRLFAETMDKNSKYSGIHVFHNCYFDHAKGAVTKEEWQRLSLRATPHLQYCRLAYKSSSNFSRARSVIGRVFLFSAAKASERAGARLVSPAKNRIKWSHFGANYLRPCRVCCRVRVSSRAVKVCQNKQITGKNPIRESKQRNVQYKKQIMSVSRRFELVARFAYAMKKNVKKKKL